MLYVIGSSDGRMRRHAEMMSVSDYAKRHRRAATDDYLNTLFSSHTAQNGTNMHNLQLGELFTRNGNFREIAIFGESLFSGNFHISSFLEIGSTFNNTTF